MVMSRKQRAQLGAFIAQKRRARREQERAARRAKRTTSLELEVYEPIGFHFNPRRHDLTLEQCRAASAQFEKVWEQQQSQPQTYEQWQQAIVEWPVQQDHRDFMAF